jgi:hypothetical protein
MPSLPVPADKTKKELIADLWDQGTPPQEIARMLDTSIGYVYKEAAIFRKHRGGKVVLTKSRKTEVTLGPEQERGNNSISKLSRTDKVKLEVEHNPLVSAPPLDTPEVKAIFAAFSTGKKPVEVLAGHGYNPEAVEIEYRRFLRLTGQDPALLAKAIIRRIITVKSDMVDAIADSYEKKGYLANEEVMTLLTFEVLHRLESGQNYVMSSMANTSDAPPDGCDRPRCRICNAPIAGALFLKNSHAARTILNANLYCPAHSG